jgi:hypothetical protein
MAISIKMSKSGLKKSLFTCVLTGLLLYTGSCLYTSNVQPVESVQIALEWNHFMLDAEVNTEGYRGPVAARAYGYVGLAAYEAAVPGMAGYQSLLDFYPDIKMPVKPSAQHYDLSTALHASYYTILEHFFISSPETIKHKLGNLKSRWDSELKEGLDQMTFDSSYLFGVSMANAIFEWSATDTLGFDANHHNYDRTYKPPSGEGKWVTSVYFPMPPLLPYWGKVRSFIIQPDDYMAKPLPEFSPLPNGFYHNQAMEVLTLSKPLSSENKWIADFWNDDRPGLTFTPAGHWLAITNQVIEKERPTIEKTLETYLRVGFALSDAIVSCFKSKYFYNVERPETFIQNNISKDWRPYSPTPPFPSYPSGHSMMGAAAARVLTQMYGENYKLTDQSHQDLPDFSTNPREFKSFREMSEENALSRIFMGVHYRMDCEEGLRLGDMIGNEINKLELEKKLTQ